MALENPTAREWLALAGQDLQLVDLALGQPEPPVGPALFHSQQAAEKALKAAIIEDGEIPPRTHDLVALVDRLVPAHPDLADLRDGARILTPYAVAPRYPPEFQEYTRDEAEEALALARTFLARIEAL